MTTDNKFMVRCWYTAYSETVVELPDGLTWQDIENWYVKWETFHFQLKGETEWRETGLDGISLDNLDTKRPSEIEIERVDEDEFTTGGSLLPCDSEED